MHSNFALDRCSDQVSFTFEVLAKLMILLYIWNIFKPDQTASLPERKLQILTLVFSLMIDLVNMLFIAHTDDSAKMAGIGLGNMFVNIISQSVILGINGGISTLAS